MPGFHQNNTFFLRKNLSWLACSAFSLLSEIYKQLLSLVQWDMIQQQRSGFKLHLPQIKFHSSFKFINILEEPEKTDWKQIRKQISRRFWNGSGDMWWIFCDRWLSLHMILKHTFFLYTQISDRHNLIIVFIKNIYLFDIMLVEIRS